MKQTYFGGGEFRKVRISVDEGTIVTVPARIGQFNRQFAVLKDRPHYAMVGLSYWANQLVHEVVTQAQAQGDAVKYDRRMVIYQVFPDAYTALRRTLHVLFGNYGRSFSVAGEKRDLAEALELQLAINEVYLGLRPDNAQLLEHTIERYAQQLISRIGLQSRNEQKRQARDLVLEASTIFDSLHRRNRGAKLTQVTALRRRIERRIEEIQAIEPGIAAQRQALIAAIGYCELIFQTTFDFLERLMPNLSESYFRCHGGNELQQKVAARLAVLAASIQRIDIRPFSFPASRIHREMLDARQSVLDGDFAGAKKQLVPVVEACKLRVIRTDMENFITFLTELLFRPTRTVPATTVKQISNGCQNLITRLSAVDEKEFIHPVCRRALLLVRQAVRQLPRDASFIASRLELVKKSLVEAAQLI